ncbi:MAG: hypothetical protein ACI837_000670 [Crocinitomicaceae bacterium]|jgi:hypothetical protein
MRHFLFGVLFLTQTVCFGQISDYFTDGNFTASPTWSGTDVDYIINATFELQLNNTVASISYLSTPHSLATLDDKEWRLWTKQTFSPSASNFGRIYLTSSSADLTTDPDGFYLQLGEAGSNDAVRLFKVDATVHTELAAGTLGQIAGSSTLGIRVVRDNLGNWSVYVDPTGGENYALEASATDATPLIGTHFGFVQVYTSSNADNFFYDSIYVGDEILDLAPPVLISATAINANLVDLLFDEPLDQTAAENVGNYSLTPVLGITSATLDLGNPALVHIVPVTAFPNGQNYTIDANNISDLSLNIAGNQSANFSFLVAEVPAAGDVVINEVMFDETPQVGLPLVEYIEIYNRSSKIFDVTGWKLGDASSAGTLTSGWLLPDGYMILTKTSGVDSFAVATGVTSFPSFNNSGDAVSLKDDLGLLLDTINYTDDWWQNSLITGGVSVERINPNDPCSDESDWTASTNSLGGTPGAINSVYDNTPDTQNPGISQLIALAPNFLEIYYTEGMDSTSLSNASFVISPTLTIQNNYVLTANPSMHTLQFNESFVGSQSYSIEIQNVGDCWLNVTTLNGTFALAEVPVAGDVIINEILFDPVSDGKDWIEVYNNSDKLIDLKNWQLANYDDDTISNIKTFTEHFLLYPDTYAVFGEDTAQIVDYYPAAVSGRMIEMDLATYSNESGTVYLMYNNAMMDEVSYLEDWHFRLLDNTDGVSLERIQPDPTLSNTVENWHSAAEAIGFATPGALNSQNYPAIADGEFSFTSDVVSPDSDGYQDVLQINYEMAGPGFVGNFTIYDDRGRIIAKVMISELLATSGTFKWEGVKDDNTKASIGTYVGVFEAFNNDGGDVFIQRKAFVVAGRL